MFWSCPEKTLQGEGFLQTIVGSMEAVSSMGSSGVARESQRRKMIWKAWQEEALLSAFNKNNYLSFANRQDLARQMGVPDSRIRVWFQNRRSRTGAVGHAPNLSGRHSSKLDSQQLQEELGSRAQGGGMPSDYRRPRTRITSSQRTILLQAFEKEPRPGFSTREELAQRTGLPEDTVHIWFQNRRARHLNRHKNTAQGQDLLVSPGWNEAREGSGGRELEGVKDSLLALAPAGDVDMDKSSPSDQPTFCPVSQPFQFEEPREPGHAEYLTQSSNTNPVEFFLDQLLSEVQVEEHGSAPLHLEPVDTIPELPLTQAVYQALLDLL